jgi:Sec-independent protein translocase protein TatA
MQVFNLGFGEIIFVLLIAVVVLGPERITVFSRKAGQWIRAMISNPLWQDVVSTSNEFRQLPNKLMEETGLQSDLDDLNIEVTDLDQAISGELDEINQFPDVQMDITPTSTDKDPEEQGQLPELVSNRVNG